MNIITFVTIFYLIIIFVVIVLYVISYGKKRLFQKSILNSNEVSEDEIGDERTVAKSAEGSFIEFFHNYAREKKLQSVSEQEVFKFFSDNFKSVKFNYISSTRRPLFLVDESKTLEKIVNTYKV